MSETGTTAEEFHAALTARRVVMESWFKGHGVPGLVLGCANTPCVSRFFLMLHSSLAWEDTELVRSDDGRLATLCEHGLRDGIADMRRKLDKLEEGLGKTLDATVLKGTDNDESNREGTDVGGSG